ncbi:hypothetical protein LMG22037_05925 [Paraburkholderia phenoliruptrix]|uniref:YCII-related domain-containing protein n=1 Tax=Paraburkholderia phenoliruptrix TaxID=252970 RepID=A0A6J5CEW0_9BURK|nr:hypothetical protein [Paraburkholderia phenoliruptrix]CAB3735043.1 hypothetical protein LMG22037_05925 [Paraburkholderia phenoliruptrix]
MAKSLFKINYAYRGMENKWREFWSHGKTVSDEDGQELNSALVGNSEFIECSNLAEAEAYAAKTYPGQFREVSRVGPVAKG